MITANFIARVFPRNPVGSAYLSGLFLLLASAMFVGVMGQGPNQLLWFGAFLIIAYLFFKLVFWRVRATGRKVRGKVAVSLWTIGGFGIQLNWLIHKLHTAFPSGVYPQPPPWMPGVCIGVMMVGLLVATMQLRDAETYFT